MSRQENKVVLILFFLLFILFSCKDEYSKRSDYFQLSQTLNEKDSLTAVIHSAAIDTIKSWINADLTYFHKFNQASLDEAEWKIDDFVLINTKKDKCVLSMLIRLFYNPSQDDIYFILGEKYQGKWWFYQGPDLVILQENYTDDKAMTALSFNTLSEIAQRNSLNWYYIEKGNGACLKELFGSGYDNYKKCKDEKYLINDKYFEAEIDIGMNPDPEKRTKWYLNEFLKSKHKE